jgi:AcrR family transcriptional regulator
MTEPYEGLRSIKKRMTRDMIADAALQLTLEKGLEHVTSDEIAHVAFVSPRTVSNYFSCKEEAVVAAGSTLPEIVNQYTKAPSDEAPLPALRRVVTSFFGARTHEQLEAAQQRLQLIENHPSLRAFQSASYGQAERDLREVIAERTGTDVDKDVFPSLVADAAVAAMRSATWVWARTNAPDERLTELLTMAFDQIESGMNVPGADSAVVPSAMPQQATRENFAEI